MLLVDTLVISLAQETVWSPLSPQGTFVHMAKTYKSVHLSIHLCMHSMQGTYYTHICTLHMHAFVKTCISTSE